MSHPMMYQKLQDWQRGKYSEFVCPGASLDCWMMRQDMNEVGHAGGWDSCILGGAFAGSLEVHLTHFAAFAGRFAFVIAAFCR